MNKQDQESIEKTKLNRLAPPASLLSQRTPFARTKTSIPGQTWMMNELNHYSSLALTTVPVPVHHLKLYSP